MKKYLLLTAAFCAIHTASFANNALFKASDQETPLEKITVAKLDSLKDPELKEIMAGNRPNLAIEFTEHTHLPISFYLEGDLAHLQESHDQWGCIEIQQTFYARYVENELMLSSNLTDWKPFTEFITGTMNVGLTVEDGKAFILIGAKTNRRA